MYLFEAHYENVHTGNKTTTAIEFDGDNLLDSEKQCYVHAMEQAYEMKEIDECLVSLEFIAN